jgi:hypothetical protein
MHWRQQLQYLDNVSTVEQVRVSKTFSEKRFCEVTEERDKPIDEYTV